LFFCRQIIGAILVSAIYSDKRLADVVKFLCGNRDFSFPAISGGFDYQGWQVFIIVKITLITSHKQYSIKNISIIRAQAALRGCITDKKSL
jgi:hypothetical protein